MGQQRTVRVWVLAMMLLGLAGLATRYGWVERNQRLQRHQLEAQALPTQQALDNLHLAMLQHNAALDAHMLLQQAPELPAWDPAHDSLPNLQAAYDRLLAADQANSLGGAALTNLGFRIKELANGGLEVLTRLAEPAATKAEAQRQAQRLRDTYAEYHRVYGSATAALDELLHRQQTHLASQLNDQPELRQLDDLLTLGTAGVLLLFGLLAFVSARPNRKPLEALIHAKPGTEPNVPEPLKPLARRMAASERALRAVETKLGEISMGKTDDPVPDELAEANLGQLLRLLAERLEQNDQHAQKADEHLRQLEQRLKDQHEQQQRQKVAAAEASRNLTRGLLVAEMDANAHLLALTEEAPDDWQLDPNKLQPGQTALPLDPADREALLVRLSALKPGQGFTTILAPIRPANGAGTAQPAPAQEAQGTEAYPTTPTADRPTPVYAHISCLEPERFLIKGLEAQPMLDAAEAIRGREQLLQRHLNAVKAEAATYQSRLERLKMEQAERQHDDGEKRKLETLLAQQRRIWQEWAVPDPELVLDFRAMAQRITETVAFALDVDRVGIWLMDRDRDLLQPVDHFERLTMAHQQRPRLSLAPLLPTVQAIQEAPIWTVANVAQDSRVASLRHAYLDAADVQALMLTPLFYGTELVGWITHERTQNALPWDVAEEAFALALAQTVTAALERGHRLLLEDEWARLAAQPAQAAPQNGDQADQHAQRTQLELAEQLEQVQDQLRQAQIGLGAHLDALNGLALVAETDAEGLLQTLNPAMAILLGPPADQQVGRPLGLLQQNPDAPGDADAIWEAARKRQPWSGTLVAQDAEGNPHPLRTQVAPKLDAEGNLKGLVVVALPVPQAADQPAAVEQQLAPKPIALPAAEADAVANPSLDQPQTAPQQVDTPTLATVVEPSPTPKPEHLPAGPPPDARHTLDDLEDLYGRPLSPHEHLGVIHKATMVIETDLNGRLLYLNELAINHLGYTAELLRDKTFNLFKAPSFPEAYYRELWRAAASGNAWQGEMELMNRGQQLFWVNVLAQPLRDDSDDPVRVLFVLHDITEHKRQEARLRTQQEALKSLSSQEAIKTGKVQDALELIADLGRQTLDAHRVSIWFYNAERTHLECVRAEDTLPHLNQAGAHLDVNLYPGYLAALEREFVIAAHDAVNDPRTHELAFDLFKPQNIHSVLDTAIRQGGTQVGILSVEHRFNKRTWELDEQSFAASLADLVSLVLEQEQRQLTEELQTAYKKLEDMNEFVMDQKAKLESSTKDVRESIRYAKRIQQNILPSKDLIDQALDNYFIVYKPRDVVGGDFYWFNAMGSKRVLCVADGTGHGVPGAFLTLLGYLLLNQIVNERHVLDPGEILTQLHQGVRVALKQDMEDTNSRDGMDAAVFVWDADTLQGHFAGANLPLHYYHEWEIHTIKPDKKAIGGEQMEEERRFTSRPVQLQKGDAIYMYTDGVIDQMGGPDDKRFGSRRLKDLFLRTQHESMATQRALLNLEWKEWKGDQEQLDDVTVFGLKV